MNVVSIEKCPNYELEILIAVLEKSFKNIGEIDKWIKKGDKVALKANLLMKKHPEDAVTTHPMLIKALTLLVQKAGGVVTILDSPAGIYSENALKSTYAATGMTQVAKETGASLNFDTSEVEVDNPSGLYLKKLKILRPLAEADVVINVPKLKTHVQMVYTGAVKNMFGAIAGEVKARYHFNMSNYEDFANALIDIFLSTKTKLTIMDAVVGMEGHGPSAGTSRQIGLILASENAFALDLAAISVINTLPKDVPMIHNAMKRNLCPSSVEGIEIRGEKIEDVLIKNFDVPHLSVLKDIQFTKNGRVKKTLSNLMPKPVIDKKQCVKCYDCVKCCPPKTIKVINKEPIIEYTDCIRCFCCQEQCPAKAISIKNNLIGNFIIRFGAAMTMLFASKVKRQK